MKGLLLKDIYQMRKYCRSILIIFVLFLVISSINLEFSFLRVFICLLVGMIPMTLLSYDERSKWDRYSIVLPVSRKISVSEKYLLGLILVFIMCAVCVLVSIISHLFSGRELSEVLTEIGFQLPVALIVPAIAMPFCFRFGTEKGRIFYLIFVGIMSAGTTILVQYTFFTENRLIEFTTVFLCLPFVALAIYFLSWLLSCRLYEAREL